MRGQQDDVIGAVCVATGALAVVAFTSVAGVARTTMPPPAQPSQEPGHADRADRGVDFDSPPDLLGHGAMTADAPGPGTPEGDASESSAPDPDAVGPVAGHPAVAPPETVSDEPEPSSTPLAVATPSSDASIQASADPIDDEPQWRWPAQGRVTSEFGPRWGRRHEGTDIAAAHGSPVVAAAGGRITTARARGGYGLVVEVVHPKGATTLYAHLSAVDVTTGETVAAGERLGAMGCTGSCTGAHLHFEVSREEAPIDPREVLP